IQCQISNFQFTIKNKMKIHNYDIHERIFNFVINTINFINKLPKTPTNLIFINQITRSVTSMGANDQEADGALSKKDFTHCYIIVRKEGKETIFWLRIIENTNDSKFSEEANKLVKEGNEIIAIVSTIVKNTNLNNK
ncbi:four helix bundle protein, partial [Patescibacteria group bacterium]|nr:four helix bundle protein [Patescibacteria group bacterium]